MKKKKVEYPKPQVFKPTKEEELEVMERVALLLCKTKCIQSNYYPELIVQGKL